MPAHAHKLFHALGDVDRSGAVLVCDRDGAAVLGSAESPLVITRLAASSTGQASMTALQEMAARQSGGVVC